MANEVTVSVDKAKIAHVVRLAGDVVSNKGLETPEVLFGLSELIGRILVQHTGGTVIEKLDTLKMLVEHADRTVRVGCQALGK